MKLVKCANNHFYDAEKFEFCPHCAGANKRSGNDEKTDFYVANQGPRNSNSMDIEGRGSFGAGTVERPTIGFDDLNAPNRLKMAMDGSSSDMNDEGKTVGFMSWGTKIPDVSDKESCKQSQGTQQPVVGWVVCTLGNSYGKCFNLYCGKNFIGRSADMDICLAGDSTVSRFRHAIIIYEPKEKKFFAQPGESHELFYLNDSVVLSNTLLKDRDVITVGKTTLVFVPFCDDRFGWEKE